MHACESTEAVTIVTKQTIEMGFLFTHQPIALPLGRPPSWCRPSRAMWQGPEKVPRLIAPAGDLGSQQIINLWNGWII